MFYPYLKNKSFGFTKAPACDVIISFNGNDKPLSALIDSGADCTFIPDDIVTSLFLKKKRNMDIWGITKDVDHKGLYTVTIKFLNLEFPDHPVVSWGKDFVLIGRDIINRYKTILDGPSLQFSIE